LNESFLSKFKAFLPAIFWSLFILLVSWNAGGLNLPPNLFDLVGTHKLAHATAYFLLFWTILYGLRKTGADTPRALIISALWCVFYRVLMEVLQYFYFPGRYFEFFDIVANIIGVFSGFAIFYFRKKQKAL